MKVRHRVAGVGLVLLIAGCGTTAPVTAAPATPGSPTVTSGPSATPSPTRAATTPGTPTSGVTASPLAVPVTTVAAANGGLKVIVQISVGGGAPVPVVLDTGSSGLLIDATAVGPDVDSTGAVSFTKDYVGASLSGSVVQAPVALGGISTPAIGVATYTADAASAGLTGGLARGILGIAAEAQAGSPPVLWSPAMQLPSPYGTVSTLDVAATGAGTWTLGPVVAAAGATTVPLVAVPGAPDVGGPWTKDVSLCWTFPGAAPACGPTDLDSGASSVLVNSAVLAATVPTGSAVALSTPDGTALWSFSSDDSVAQSAVRTANLGATTHYNTGIGFFVDHLVSFDYGAGTLTITPR